MNAQGHNKDKGPNKDGGSKIGRDAGKGKGSTRGGDSKIGRDAESGQFRSVSELKRRSRTTTVETIKQPKPEGRSRTTTVETIKQPKPKDRDLDSVAQAWEALRRSSGIGPVRNEADYDERVALLNALIDTVRDDEAHPLAGLMEIVGEFIENYETTHYPMPEAEPREALHFLMEEHGLKQADLPEIGSQGVVSEILAGKRGISARQAKLLAARFNVSAAVFI